MRSPTSALAKLLAWHCEAPLQPHEVLAHQADFVAAQLCGRGEGGGYSSDWHNALKLGHAAAAHHPCASVASTVSCAAIAVAVAASQPICRLPPTRYDVRGLQYPTWMEQGQLGDTLQGRLPKVVMPGQAMGAVTEEAAARWSLPKGCQVVGGTTDSIAAFLASGAKQEGEAVRRRRRPTTQPSPHTQPATPATQPNRHPCHPRHPAPPRPSLAQLTAAPLPPSSGGRSRLWARRWPSSCSPPRLATTPPEGSTPTV